MTGLASHLSSTDPAVQDRLARIAAGLVAQGMDPVTAASSSVAVLDGTAQQQAAVLSFEWLFVLLAILFLVVMPLAFFLRQDEPTAPAEVHEV